MDLDDAKGDRTRVKLPHPEIIGAAEVGHFLLIDDGKVKLVVTGKGADFLECRVEVAGKVKDRKGVNTPDSVLKISPLTPKDRADLKYMLGIGVDWVALRYVDGATDCIICTCGSILATQYVASVSFKLLPISRKFMP